MIPSFLSNLASSNTATAPISIPNTTANGETTGIRRIPTMETALSSSPPLSHPLLRNQWATRTRTSAIVSPSTSPLVQNYPSRRSSSESTLADDQREVFSIFSSLD